MVHIFQHEHNHLPPGLYTVMDEILSVSMHQSCHSSQCQDVEVCSCQWRM